MSEDTKNNKEVEWDHFSINKKTLNIDEWSTKDYISYIREKYYNIYFTSLALAPAFTNMELSKLKDILGNSNLNANYSVKLLMKEYIDWYFKYKIFHDHIKMKTWSLRNINNPSNISLFLLEKSNDNHHKLDKKTKKNQVKKKSVSNFHLKKYINSDEKLFIQDYGVIIPFAYLVTVNRFDWPGATGYIKRGIKKCIESSLSLDDMVDVTNAYGPYDKFKKLDIPSLLSELSVEFSYPFEKIRISNNVRENLES